MPYALRPWMVNTARSMPSLDAGRRVVHVDLPLPVAGVLDEHLHEHLGPVLRLEAALAGQDGDERVAVVELAGEPRRELEVVRGDA